MLPREQFGAIGLNELLRIAPAGAIVPNQFLRIAPAGAIGSNWSKTNCSELLPREQLGAFGPNELLRIAPAGAIGSNWSKRIAPNRSHGSNLELFLQTNCSESLPREQLGAIGQSELLRIAPAGAILDILDSCRSHTWRLVTPAGVMQIDI